LACERSLVRWTSARVSRVSSAGKTRCPPR